MPRPILVRRSCQNDCVNPANKVIILHNITTTPSTYLDEAPAAYDPHDDTITSGEALFLFRDLRQEVTILAQLSHPNIMSLLGVSLRPMCLVMELAPMGSLFSILDHKLEAIKTAHADLPSSNLRMPGGVLGHEISARIALQVNTAFTQDCDHSLSLGCSSPALSSHYRHSLSGSQIGQCSHLVT